jgi:apolipoprotein N-acyltransferase
MYQEISPGVRITGPVLLGLVLLSSVLLPLSLPNEILHYGNAALSFVCLVPALVAVSLAPTFKAASRLGVAFGAVSTALGSYWLMFFQGFSVWTYGGTILGYVGYNALLFPFLRAFSRIRPRYRPLLLAAAWAVYEYFKSVGFLGYPWGLVAYPAGDILPMIQFIDITGIWGLSFLMALVNAIIAEAVLFTFAAAPPWDGSAFTPGAIGKIGGPTPVSGREPGPFEREILFVIFLIALAVGYGFYRLAAPIPARDTAGLLLVQQNIDTWNEGAADKNSVPINQALTLQGIKEAPRPVDLAVWSELSVSNIWVVNGNRLIPENNSLVPYARKAGTYTFYGSVVALDVAERQLMNGAVLLSPEGAVIDTYGKIHPVPFAESIPFLECKPVKLFFKNVIGIWNAWTMGSRYTVFRVPLRSGGSLSFGAPICFEDAFSDLCRRFILEGADIWINLTNDFWSKTVSSEVQHFQAAKFRAVENRRVLVRSTNGGVTAVVGPHGEVLASLPLFERKQIFVEVPVYADKALSPYTVFGDYFPRALAGLLLLVLVFDVFARKRHISG